MSNLQINQFQQVPVLGQVEMEPLQTGTLSCQVSPNQATAMTAGTRVKLDTAITNGPGKPPQVIAGGGSGQSIGVIIHSAKQDSYNALDMVEIAYFGGPILWLLNTAVAIAPGTDCEDNGSNLMQATSGGNTKIAVALDYIPASTLGRYILLGLVGPVV